jgi:hypothetical protein
MTVCGTLFEARNWWTLACPWVFKTHTDARAIKGMKITYTSKVSAFFVQKVLLAVVCVAILTTAAIIFPCKDLFVFPSPNKEETVVTEFLMNGLLLQNYKSFFLGMQKNMTNYVAFLHRFAP